MRKNKVYLDIVWATPIALILGVMSFLSGMGIGVIINQ
jgi:hypothetical protein